MYKVYVLQQLERVSEHFIQSALPMLPEERRRKAMHYRQANDRKNCVIAYLMLKIGLKECFQIVDFTLGYGEHGKPYLAEYPDVYFNISHCGCQTAHCGRRKPHSDFGGNTSPIVLYRHLPQTCRGLTADCRSLV